MTNQCPNSNGEIESDAVNCQLPAALIRKVGIDRGWALAGKLRIVRE